MIKKLLSIAAIAALLLSTVSCNDMLNQLQQTNEELNEKPEEKPEENKPEEKPEEKPEVQAIDITVQLSFEEANFAVAGITVTLSDEAATFTVEKVTDETGAAVFTLKPGKYVASASYTTNENGNRLAYTGENKAIEFAEGTTPAPFVLSLTKIASKQIIIKELYFGGCTNPETEKGYVNDSYVILYNNSDVEADATNVVFGFLAPYNGHGTNKYRGEAGLSYEGEDVNWIPAYGAIWWFTAEEVKIPAFSQIVIAIFGAIDHTATVSTSVNLANKDYYWMSNSGVAAYTNAKYSAADVIPDTHYLTCSPFTMGNAWAMSNNSPAFFIGNMPRAEVDALCKDTENYDHTLGTAAAFNVVKFPKANVIDALEVFSSANLEKSNVRFPASINTGYVAVTNNKGYTAYRNVDKEATEARSDNKYKLIYGYDFGTVDIQGTTDPANIDAEASAALGAHIVYVQTNNSTNDFHQRAKASLKK